MRQGILRRQIPTLTVLGVFVSAIFVAAAFGTGGVDPWARYVLLAGIALATMLSLRGLAPVSTTPWWRQPDVWLGLFLLLATLLFFWTPSPRTSLEALVLFIAALLFFRLGRLFVTTAGQTVLLRWLVLGGALVALWSWYQYIDFGQSFRLFGPYRNSDVLGAGLLVPLFASWGLLRSATTRASRRVMIAAFVLLLGSFLVTSSVPAALGALASMLFFVIVVRPQVRRRTILRIGAAGMLLVILVAALQLSIVPSEGSFLKRLTGFTQASAAASLTQRLSFQRSSLAMANDHPLTGVGFGLWGDFFPQYQRSLIERTSTPHSLPSQLLGELGWPGLLFYLLVLMSAFILLVRALKHPSATPMTRSIALGAAALAVPGIVDIAHSIPALLFTFWFVLGVSAASTGSTTSEEKWDRRHTIPFVVMIVMLLLWSTARFVTSSLVAAAEQGGENQQWVDAMATADLSMRLIPSPQEEQRVALLYGYGARFPFDKETAKTYAERALRSNPVNAPAHLLLGRMAQANGDLTTAEAQYRDGLRDDPVFLADLAVALSGLLNDSKRYTESRAFIESYGDAPANLGKNPKAMSDLWENAAVASLALGEKDRAAIELQRALELATENESAKKLLDGQSP